MVRVKENGRVIGGYADRPWASPEEGTFVHSTKAFLCLLRGAGGGGRERLDVQADCAEDALYHYRDRGPYWNGGLGIHPGGGRHWTENACYYKGLASGEEFCGTQDGYFEISEREVFKTMK